MKTRMFFAVVAVLMFHAAGYGWGVAGHRIVARIAENHLSSRTRAAVADLLGSESLVDISTWTDEIRRRPEFQWSSTWHGMNLPNDTSTYEKERDCRAGCVVSAVHQFTGVLKDPRTDRKARTTALKFLVHFISDLHQPIHVTSASPGTRPAAQVQFFSQTSKLHTVWDALLIEHVCKPWEVYAKELDEKITPEQFATWTADIDPAGWADESHERTVRYAYDLPKDGKIGQEYFDRCIPVIDERLCMAGVRLAARLNAIFDPQQVTSRPVTSAKTNFVVILADDLGYGDLGCYGHPVIKTPNLDQLARDGIRFTDYYAPAPVCSPSRAGLLTGRTPHRCGIDDWIPKGSPMHLRGNELTMATLLKRAGYATCFVGKWHCNGQFNSPKQPQPNDHGFDYWFATQNNAAPTHENPINFACNGQPVGPLTGYSSDIIVDKAIQWLDTRDTQKPFCLFVWFHTPHELIATSPEYVGQYPDAQPRERAEYYGNITQMDQAVGRLLKELDQAGQRENTLVFFASDNGPETLKRYPTGTHSYGSPGPLRGMKLHLYEGGIRVPGIIRWSAHIRSGQVCHEPIIGTDILPTLCDIVGIPVPMDRAIDGTSILPVFDGHVLMRPTPLFWWYSLAIGEPKLAIRQGPWKLLVSENMEGIELYDLGHDMEETKNMASSEPERVKTMLATLQHLSKEVEAEAPVWPKSQPAHNK